MRPRAAARLRGEHAVRILDVDDEGGAPFLVMEHLEGSDLDRLVRRAGPLSVERAVDYVLQACAGLAEAHALGIVHRDVKPANIFLAKTSRGGEIVKILDFGMATASAPLAAARSVEAASEGLPGPPVVARAEANAEAKASAKATAIAVAGATARDASVGARADAGRGKAAPASSEDPLKLEIK